MSASISPLFALSSQGGGSTPVLQTKNILLNANGTVSVTPDSGYDGLEQVNVTVSTRFKPVGGIIFYIDSTSTKTYKFYDSNYNEISNVAVGDTPAFYEEISDGNGKEKYYVYHNELFSGQYFAPKWGSKGDDTLATGTSIGTGKTNTETILAFYQGTYKLTDNQYLWYYVVNARTNLLAGCNDWYIGTKDEFLELKSFQIAKYGEGDDNEWFTYRTPYKTIWSSCDFHDYPDYAREWSQSSQWNSSYKTNSGYFFFMRSF